MTAQSLQWSQVNAWRLAQHCLTSRLERGDFVQAVTRVVGVQVQVMSAAELALWARADRLSPQDVQAALWGERTLIKTWAMRGTLHLLSADELCQDRPVRVADECDQAGYRSRSRAAGRVPQYAGGTGV